jgi:GAG-pre-integrase domain
MLNIELKKNHEGGYSSKLWHYKFGHISRDRMQHIIKNEILPTFDFSDFENCIECVNEKFVKRNKKGFIRSGGLLKIIHTGICGPFPTPSLMNINYLSLLLMIILVRHVYLISKKSETLDKFKIFKAEV